MLQIHNVIDEVSDGKIIARDWAEHEGVTVHRVGYNHRYGINLGNTAPEICAHFTGKNSTHPEVARATGGQNAYTIMVGREGIIWQCLPLGDVGHHARAWSSKTIGIAVIGDPRYISPTPEQYWALVDACSLVSRVLGTSSDEIKGHDERKGARGDISKACPGRLLSMDQLRYDTHAAMRAHSEAEAVRLGLVP
jgi:hypothetical protein